jgi:hypothetical protein
MLINLPSGLESFNATQARAFCELNWSLRTPEQAEEICLLTAYDLVIHPGYDGRGGDPSESIVFLVQGPQHLPREEQRALDQEILSRLQPRGLKAQIEDYEGITTVELTNPSLASALPTTTPFNPVPLADLTISAIDVMRGALQAEFARGLSYTTLLKMALLAIASEAASGNTGEIHLDLSPWVQEDQDRDATPAGLSYLWLMRKVADDLTARGFRAEVDRECFRLEISTDAPSESPLLQARLAGQRA